MAEREEQFLEEDAAAAAISRDIVRIHEESYGAGVHHIRTHINDDLVVVVIDIELMISERTLLAGGEPQTVRKLREDFQKTIEPTFIAVVERATGRRVRAFVSHVSLDPLFTVELFRLAEEESAGDPAEPE